VGSLLAVNFIELEDYIKGILFHEASHYWPMEALKVQAIISRTYAIYQCEQNKAKDFDVTSDIYSQVYGGIEFGIGIRHLSFEPGHHNNFLRYPVFRN
jgi:stage II sporulation protein D